MGELIPIRPLPDDRETAAYDAFCVALEAARRSGRLIDMRAAVEAYDRWGAVMRQVENERGRR